MRWVIVCGVIVCEVIVCEVIVCEVISVYHCYLLCCMSSPGSDIACQLNGCMPVIVNDAVTFPMVETMPSQTVD